MRKSELYFEEIGESFDAFMSSYDVQQRTALINRFLNKVELSGSALEVGCGTGAITPVLLNRGLSVSVGDISERLAQATAVRFGVHGVCCDAMRIPLPDRSVNVVMSSEVIEHVPDPQIALREMSRVVAEDGFLIVTSPNRLWYPLLWIAQKFGVRKFSGNELWLWPHEARQIISSAGLTVIEIGGCHLFPWQIPGAKAVLPILDNYAELLWPFMINWGILAQRRCSKTS